MRAGLATLCAGAAACGGVVEAPPPAPARGAPPAAAIAAPAGADDALVAHVNGRPVWGSCVAAQAARGAGSARAALDECIDFELLAQLAEARGLAGDPEVGEATRRALVGRLVTTDFEARVRGPADVREMIDRVVDRYRDQLDKPELRASAFVRIEVAKGAPAEAEAAARALADKLHAALAGARGLFPINLREIADRVTAGSGLTVSHNTFRAATREALAGAFAEALFGIPEVGRVSPPVRTDWGWDIVLLTQLLPPRVYTREEVGAEVFPEIRRQAFQLWVNGIVKSLGVKIAVDASRLDGDGEAGGSGGRP